MGGIRTQLNRGPRRIHLRDRTSQEIHAFPTAATEVVFGQGYTIWRGEWQGLKVELQISVSGMPRTWMSLRNLARGSGLELS